MINGRQRRQRSERYGRLAEHVAGIMLLLQGYRVLARRFKTRSGEVDLIAVRGSRLAFVEVKARRTAAEADLSLVNQDADRLAAAAEAFVARRPRYQQHDVSLDAILFSADRWPRHLTNALQSN